MKISYAMLLLSFSPKTTLEYLYDYFILLSIFPVENLQKYKNLLMGCLILFKKIFSCNKTQLKIYFLFLIKVKYIISIKVIFSGLCLKTGIQERGTKCEECGEWGECYILGNVAKHSGECCQMFWGMLPNIQGNVVKHSRECHKTFRGMSPSILGNILHTFFIL